ncbi:unnamed protein product [Urochloa humidicola]
MYPFLHPLHICTCVRSTSRHCISTTIKMVVSSSSLACPRLAEPHAPSGRAIASFLTWWVPPKYSNPLPRFVAGAPRSSSSPAAGTGAAPPSSWLGSPAVPVESPRCSFRHPPCARPASFAHRMAAPTLCEFGCGRKRAEEGWRRRRPPPRLSSPALSCAALLNSSQVWPDPAMLHLAAREGWWRGSDAKRWSADGMAMDDELRRETGAEADGGGH